VRILRVAAAMLESDVVDGLSMAVGTLIATALLDMASVPTVRLLLKQAGGGQLYAWAWALQIRNHLFLGAAAVMTAVMLARALRGSAEPLGLGACACATTGILLFHSFWYHYAHKAMHSRQLFWMHRFHHKFSTIVVPSTANAVTIYEYIFAYVAPFPFAALALRPDRTATLTSIALISGTNLLIHTPGLEAASRLLLPRIFVTTGLHLDHHRKMDSHFSAPTFNVGWFVGEN